MKIFICVSECSSQLLRGRCWPISGGKACGILYHHTPPWNTLPSHWDHGWGSRGRSGEGRGGRRERIGQRDGSEDERALGGKSTRVVRYDSGEIGMFALCTYITPCLYIIYVQNMAYILMYVYVYTHTQHTHTQKKSKVFHCRLTVTQSGVAGMPVH